MHTQPERRPFDRHPPSDQPWLGFPITQHAAMAALGFGPAAQQGQPAVPPPRHAALALALQPRHALSSGALCAAEASVRGDFSLTPDNPENSLRISTWLLESACHEAQDWNAMQDLPRTLPGSALRFSPEVTLSVAIPVALFRRDRLVIQTKQALARSGLLPCLLELQLPEQALADGDTDMLLSLMALRDLGVGLGLDHFGTLAASPSVLQRLPLTAVKLDPNLTRDIVKNRATRITVKAAIALAHALGTTVLAIDIDNPTQRDILADLGCDEAQGPIFGGTVRPDVFHSSLLVPRWR